MKQKIFKLLTLVVCIATAISCSTKKPADLLIGTWEEKPYKGTIWQPTFIKMGP
jgi:hypothetical protein